MMFFAYVQQIAWTSLHVTPNNCHFKTFSSWYVVSLSRRIPSLLLQKPSGLQDVYENFPKWFAEGYRGKGHEVCSSAGCSIASGSGYPFNHNLQ